jgi:hypothetical protein
VVLKSDDGGATNGNTGRIFIGASDVTADTTAGTGGTCLRPGDSITIPIDNANKLYAIASSANQKLSWVTLN